MKVLGFQHPNNEFLYLTVIIYPDNYKFLFGNPLRLSNYYNALNCNTNNCDFILFNNEYLFCCSCNNYIICTRLNSDFNVINNFKLNSEGENSYIKIMNNINFLSIFFYKNNDNSLYKKNIYPPTCNNIYKDLFRETKINIIEFFERKPDTNYKLTFDEFILK